MRAVIMNTLRKKPEQTALSPPAAWSVVALTAALIALPVSAVAAELPVNLGSAVNFAVLAGTGITNTGATTVSGSAGGDMGSHPTGSFTGDTLVTTTGTKYLAAEQIVADAKADLVTAYDDAASRAPTPDITVGPDLAGETLTAGVYNSGSFGLTGKLTLDAEDDPSAVFIFQTSSDLVTDSGSSIELVGGAQACNVFWQIGSSAILETNSTFVGHIFALTSITAKTGATIHGQLLARNGTVTLDSNTIVNDLCEAVPLGNGSDGNGSDDSGTPDAEAPAPTPDEQTVDGGELPETGGIGWMIALVLGASAAIIGGAGYIRSRRGV
jgi:LPXTG-motif cell wall-anchored protein